LRYRLRRVESRWIDRVLRSNAVSLLFQPQREQFTHHGGFTPKRGHRVHYPLLQVIWQRLEQTLQARYAGRDVVPTRFLESVVYGLSQWLRNGVEWRLSNSGALALMKNHGGKRP